jgi:sterol desaturase/sphingolipid hydroxylase (fatty acid hydroxylase superfamily)
MNYLIYFIIVNTIHLLATLAEFLYSKQKKDEIHSSKGTFSNLLGSIFFRLTSNTTNIWIINMFLLAIFYFDIQIAKPTFGTFIFLIILIDFIYYIFHYIHHKIEILWLFHSVHHGDNKFNLSTAFRTSWLLRIYYPILFLIPLISIGFAPVTILLGLAVHYDLSTRIQHAAYLRKKTFFDYIFITPHSHSIHHDHDHQNSNFGGIFSIWDRLFGTYVDKIDSFTPGIKGYRQDNLIMMQLDPFIKYFLKYKKKKWN